MAEGALKHPLWPALLVLAPALWWLGSGPMNGDAAAYAAQAVAGDVTDRWTHAGYVALFVPFGRLGIDVVSWLMDLCTLLAAVGLVAAVQRWRSGLLPDPWLGMAAAAVVVPHAAFGEVDLPWLCAAAASVQGWALWMGLAVALSPAAAVVLPFVVAVRARQPLGPLFAALVVVLVLSALSAGGFWVGERGVLRMPHPDLSRTAAAIVWGLPWPLLLAALPASGKGSRPRAGWPVGLLGLVLFLPADLPVAVPVGLALAVAAATTPKRWLFQLAVVLQIAVGWWGLWARGTKVAHEQAMVSYAASVVGPTVGLVAPFTYGARVGVLLTGDPYGIAWRPPGSFLRDQQDRWCAATPDRSLVLPAGTWVAAHEARQGCP